MREFYQFYCGGQATTKHSAEYHRRRPSVPERKTNLASKRDRAVWFENKIHPPAAGSRLRVMGKPNCRLSRSVREQAWYGMNVWCVLRGRWHCDSFFLLTAYAARIIDILEYKVGQVKSFYCLKFTSMQFAQSFDRYLWISV